MSECDIIPEVLNAKFESIGDNITILVTYECLTGFYMSGSSRVSCDRSKGTWGATPTCVIINKDTHLFTTVNVTTEEWWYYLLAGLLGLIALTLIIAALCHCCWCPTHLVSVYPFNSNSPKEDRRTHPWCPCCRQRKILLTFESRDLKDNVFPVPDNASRCDHHKEGGGVHYGTHNLFSPGHTEKCETTGRRAFNPAAQGRISEVHSKSNTVSDGMTSVESPREAQVLTNIRPAKDPGKVWMPHKHNVRNINTSTK